MMESVQAKSAEGRNRTGRGLIEEEMDEGNDAHKSAEEGEKAFERGRGV